jgi:8-oxo-dGTP diphosphatase
VIYAAALFERHDDHLLIARPVTSREDARHWVFPRGRANPGESAEAAMRRFAEADLGVRIEIVVGQPPFIARVGDEDVEMRYFFCGIITGEPRPGPYEEVRWVSKAHLREYDFDAASMPVVEWLLEK